MAGGIGLSVGATNLAGVATGRSAVVRSAVLTMYAHRPPELGVPGENPAINESGLVVTDFVDRVGDPVALVASDGSSHRGEVLLADALRAMLYATGRPDGGVVVTHPAHWRAGAVDALRGALGAVPEFAGPGSPSLVSDAAAALTALRDAPGVPTGGVVMLCDFGGTGTTVSLADAAAGFRPIGPAVRHADLSGGLIDQALLTHVMDDLTAAGAVDVSATSAIGALRRLRGQCRLAKERLSTVSVTSLVAELQGYRSEVRVTRNELDEVIAEPLARFAAVMRETLDRNGIRSGDLVAVATAGGGASIPIITTTLSQHLGVPVITTARPELIAATGAGLSAAVGRGGEGAAETAIAPTAAAVLTSLDPPGVPAGSGSVGALAWSEADDAPDVAPADPYDYRDGAAEGRAGAARPQLQFGAPEPAEALAPIPWYRRPVAALAAAAIVAVAAIGGAVLLTGRDDTAPSPPTTPATTTTEAPAPPSAPQPPPAEAPPPAEPPQTHTVTREAPPPVTVTAPPPAPPPTTEPPPPPPTSEAPATSEAPPTSQVPPTSEAPATTTRPRLFPNVPEIPTIPGLPTFFPRPGGGGP